MRAYISEISYSGMLNTDFIEVAVNTGTDLSGYTIAIYDKNGNLESTVASLGTVETTVAGKDVYTVDRWDAGFVDINKEGAVALVDDLGNIVQFISFDVELPANDGPAAGLTSTSIGTNASSGNTMQSDDRGATYYEQASPNRGTIPCYAPGTLIDTPDGPRAVETLQPGDLVMTLDHGPQAIRWTRSGDHPLEDAEVEAKPVQIKAGALGRNLPAQDLIVSPQHRILVGGGAAAEGLRQRGICAREIPDKAAGHPSHEGQSPDHMDSFRM